MVSSTDLSKGYCLISMTTILCSSAFLETGKALSHCAIFHATCRAKSHETLHSVTYLAAAENVARQLAESVAESRTRFYFLQRFQATFPFVAPSHVPIAKCERL